MVPAERSDELLRLLPCEAGNEHYCLDMSSIRSIQRSDLLQLNPRNAEPLGWLLGAEEIPVYGLEARLGRARTAGVRQGRILILRGEQRRGLLIDRVSRGLAIEPQQIYPLPAAVGGRARRLLRGVLVVEDRLSLYFDPEVLLAEAEPETAPSPPAPPARPRPARPRLQPQGAEGSGRIVFFSTSYSRSFDRPVLYGLSIRQVVEVLELPPLVSVPQAPAHVKGLASWRGRPIPVLDLDRRFGWSRGSSETDERLVVARAGGQTVAFPVRKDVRVISLPIEHRGSATRIADLSLTRGIFELEHETLVVPDLAALAAPSAADQVGS